MAPSIEAAELALAAFKERWDSKYPSISKQWQLKWDLIIPQISFPNDIRKVVYTTNAIESINRQIRKIIKSKGVFPNDEAIKKILFLVLNNASKRWTMPFSNWPLALNQFDILFPNRLSLFTH